MPWIKWDPSHPEKAVQIAPANQAVGGLPPDEPHDPHREVLPALIPLLGAAAPFVIPGATPSVLLLVAVLVPDGVGV